jgi:hypothetical protein
MSFEAMCPRECGPMVRQRHPHHYVSFLVCLECEALCFGSSPGPLPEDQLEKFLRRHQLRWPPPLIDAPSDSPIPAELMSHENRIALLRSNRSMSASELGRLLGGTSFYGPTYVLIISAFCEAFPDMPRQIVSVAAQMWNGVGGNQTDEEFDQTLASWLGTVRT